MQIDRDDIWLCADCHLRANGAGDDMEDAERAAEVDAALEAMGPHLHYAGHDESERPDPEHVRVEPYNHEEEGDAPDDGDDRISVSEWEHRTDQSFSWSPCDCCDSRLGGARYYYITLKS